ncbi:hypothetical protein GCM10027075_29050 [Streptomyces heilongjiangensis]
MRRLPRETAYDSVGAPAGSVVSAATATYACIRAMDMNGQPPQMCPVTLYF